MRIFGNATDDGCENETDALMNSDEGWECRDEVVCWVSWLSTWGGPVGKGSFVGGWERLMQVCTCGPIVAWFLSAHVCEATTSTSNSREKMCVGRRQWLWWLFGGMIPALLD